MRGRARSLHSGSLYLSPPPSLAFLGTEADSGWSSPDRHYPPPPILLGGGGLAPTFGKSQKREMQLPRNLPPTSVLNTGNVFSWGTLACRSQPDTPVHSWSWSVLTESQVSPEQQELGSCNPKLVWLKVEQESLKEAPRVWKPTHALDFTCPVPPARNSLQGLPSAGAIPLESQSN